MNIVEVKNLGIKFKREKGKKRDIKCRRSLSEIFKKRKKLETFWALRDINFNLKNGEILGVVGNNGAGKSTLLKLLVGVFYPDEGEISVRGRVSSLLSLGAGFMPDLSGKDNIYLNGSFLGLNKKKIDKIYDQVVSFAELEKSIYSPIKHYSSGMKARLGFSIAVHVSPEILIIDEVLATGDKNFKKKAENKMMEIMNKAKVIIIVSHNMSFISKFCSRTIWLENGRIKGMGDTEIVVANYLESR